MASQCNKKNIFMKCCRIKNEFNQLKRYKQKIKNEKIKTFTLNTKHK